MHISIVFNFWQKQSNNEVRIGFGHDRYVRKLLQIGSGSIEQLKLRISFKFKN